MFDMFKRKPAGIPPHHRTAAFMNLAFSIVPTDICSVGTWDQRPDPLAILTDEGDIQTGLTTIGEHSTDTETLTLELDLGGEYEVYEIVVKNKTGAGFKKHSTDQDVTLVTVDAAAAGTTRDTQTVTGDNAFHDSTLHYVGDGIPVQKVQIKTLMNSAVKYTLDLSEVEVYGC